MDLPSSLHSTLQGPFLSRQRTALSPIRFGINTISLAIYRSPPVSRSTPQHPPRRPPSSPRNNQTERKMYHTSFTFYIHPSPATLVSLKVNSEFVISSPPPPQPSEILSES